MLYFTVYHLGLSPHELSLYKLQHTLSLLLLLFKPTFSDETHSSFFTRWNCPRLEEHFSKQVANALGHKFETHIHLNTSNRSKQVGNALGNRFESHIYLNSDQNRWLMHWDIGSNPTNTWVTHQQILTFQ